jgi:hypothetical protein
VKRRQIPRENVLHFSSFVFCHAYFPAFFVSEVFLCCVHVLYVSRSERKMHATLQSPATISAVYFQQLGFNWMVGVAF